MKKIFLALLIASGMRAAERMVSTDSLDKELAEKIHHPDGSLLGYLQLLITSQCHPQRNKSALYDRNETFLGYLSTTDGCKAGICRVNKNKKEVALLLLQTWKPGWDFNVHENKPNDNAVEQFPAKVILDRSTPFIFDRKNL